MDEAIAKPSAAADVALPVELVTLSRLKTRSGEPVRVMCEAIDELEMARVLKALPGGREAINVKGRDDDAILDAFHPLAQQLIERGTYLLGPEGEEIRPAFWFTAPVAGALPGRLLSRVDVTMLAKTLLTLRGYLGGAAADAGFHAGGSGGDGAGEGAVDVLERARDLAP